MTDPVVATKQMIEQVFDGAATSYNRTGPSIFTRFGTRLVEQMPLKAGAHVLDVATGTGAALLPVARRIGPKGHVTGIDLSGAMLKEAERAVNAEGLTNAELRKMDAENIQFPDQTFDAALCGFGLFLFPGMEAALHEMHRVLKPGGCIGVSIFGKKTPPFTPGWSILFRQVAAYQIGVRMPQPIAYEPDEVKALLSRFDFHSIEINSETNDIIYKNLEDWWGFQLTLGSRATILGMDEETRSRFKEEYFAKLRPLFRRDGLHLSAEVIYAIARRGGSERK